VPWSNLEGQEKKAKRKAAWVQCKRLAQTEDILEEFSEGLERQGLAGERKAGKIIFLALISRFLSRPVSLVVTATSSAGKSYTVEQILGFFPPSAHYALTAMSERALAYSTEPLSHRFLVLYEGAALNSDFANYLVRSLLSEGRVRYETVEKTPEGLEARLIEREGPTGLIMTTTAVSLHPENETRHLVIALSDSPAQTRRILRAIAAQHGENRDRQNSREEMTQWRALQEWLELVTHEVVVPYAPALAELIPSVAVRLRRDFTAVLNLIEAHAILHQGNRELDDQGRILATLRDYQAVRDLVDDIVSEGLEQTASKTIRQTVGAVDQICSLKGETGRRVGGEPWAATVKEVAKKLRIDRSAASRRVKDAVKRGYLKNLETKRGQPHRLVVGDLLPDQQTVLPEPEEVKNQWKRMR
jgi:MarR family